MALENNAEATTSEPFSAEKYFATQPPPPTLEEDVARVRDFVRKHQAAKRKVVLVTVRVGLLITARMQGSLIWSHHGQQSGGTTVPLELNV